jgi:signal transduction histidine kinase
MKKKLIVSDENDYLKFLKAEKEISDKIINHSRSMISVINRNYIYEKVNSTFCNTHRVTYDSMVGKSLGEVWGYETFNSIIKKNIDLCFTGRTVRYEASFDLPQLGKRYFEVVFRPVSEDNNEINYILAETFDIDDLIRSRLIAIENEEALRRLETNLPIGFLRCDTEGRIMHANKTFLRLMDCNDEFSVTSMNIKQFYPGDSLFEIQLNYLLEKNSKTFGRVLLINCKGREVPCRISGFMAADDSGATSFIDFIIEDLSYEMMLENRLIQAQKLETIGALAGGIAHDFNNILATISGYSEMLQDDLPKNSLLSDKVRKIQGAVNKAQSLTNQILTFSRQVEQEKIPVSVAEVVKDTIGFLKSALPHNITVKSRITRKNANVFADPTQLFRVFLNLMTNAIQAMEENGGTLSVNMTVTYRKLVMHELNKDIVADEYVLLTFKDTGKGMDPSLLGRIFEPFFTTREVGKGTGLGLSVIYGIISELEGEILVSSQKGKGSVFYVYLPVSSQYADFSGNLSDRKKIVLIKGNEYESRIFSMALENSGFSLSFVSEQMQLIKVMSDVKEKPDLIIYMSDSKQITPEDFITIFRQLVLPLRKHRNY